MKRLAGFLVGIVGLALAGFSGASLATTECNTGPPPNALSGTIVGGVVVNAGDFCVLDGANVSGGVQVNGGILIACASTINGGLVADGAANVIVGAEEIGCSGVVINGGVHISNTGPGVTPGGAPSIALENSAIKGSVHLTGNQGPIVVANDTIAGGLFCSNNAFDLDDEHDTGGAPPIVTGPIRCKFAD
jgi:hypothetical protein